MCIACDNAWARLGASLYANSLAVTTDLLRQFAIAASQAKIKGYHVSLLKNAVNREVVT